MLPRKCESEVAQLECFFITWIGSSLFCTATEAT